MPILKVITGNKKVDIEAYMNVPVPNNYIVASVSIAVDDCSGLFISPFL